MAAARLLSSTKRLLGPVIREMQLYPAIFRAGSRPRVAFLTSNGKAMSGLLRAHKIADGLTGHGWTSIVLDPGLGLARHNRILRQFKPDVVVLQKCRNPFSRAEYLKDWPLVLDIDDADFLDPTLSSVLEDVARQARAVMAGSRFLHDWAVQFNDDVSIVWTGTPLSTAPRPDHHARQPIITWAQADPLGYPDEMRFCRDVMLDVVSRIGPVDFRLYRCVGQENHPILREMATAGVRLQILPFMDYAQFLVSLREVSIGLSPLAGRNFSLGKSFGKILGYIDARVPVICSDEADHDLFFAAGSGIVSNDRKTWADAICRLIADPDARNRMADAAHDAALSRLSTEAVTLQVHRILSQVRLKTLDRSAVAADLQQERLS